MCESLNSQGYHSKSWLTALQTFTSEDIEVKLDEDWLSHARFHIRMSMAISTLYSDTALLLLMDINSIMGNLCQV